MRLGYVVSRTLLNTYYVMPTFAGDPRVTDCRIARYAAAERAAYVGGFVPTKDIGPMARS